LPIQLIFNSCCGTHLPSLHDLQLYLLPNLESISRANGGGKPTTTARLYFLAGPRLLQHLNSTHTQLTATANLLSCALPSVPDRVTQVIDDRAQLNKRVNALEIELAKFLAEKHLDALRTGPSTQHIHRTDDSAGALAFLGLVAGAIVAGAEPGLDYLLVLTSAPSAPSHTSTNIVTLVGSDAARVKAIGEGLKTRMGVKGGGKDTRWSGKHTGVWKESKEHVLIREILGL
jgi:misacylated tRNA(Ala) deacylase